MLQYSPESFSATEVEFAKEISEAVMDVWQPTPERKMILNLPDTVEVAMPNVYADQIEWMCRNIRESRVARSSACTRTTIAAPASPRRNWACSPARIASKGTLFGNGERTGNLDIVTVALNLYMHGIDAGAGFLRPQRIARSLRALHRHDRAGAPAVRRRTGLHRLQRLAPGCDQEGPGRVGAKRAPSIGTCRI